MRTQIPRRDMGLLQRNTGEPPPDTSQKLAIVIFVELAKHFGHDVHALDRARERRIPVALGQRRVREGKRQGRCEPPETESHGGRNAQISSATGDQRQGR